MALMFGEAAALPCVLEEQVQIAHLLTAYDRWLVCYRTTCLNTSCYYDLFEQNLTAGHSFAIASVVGPNQWQALCANHIHVLELQLRLTCNQVFNTHQAVCIIAAPSYFAATLWQDSSCCTATFPPPTLDGM